MRRDALEVRKATLASLLRGARAGIRFNEHIEADGPTVFAQVCKMGLDGIVSKRKASSYRSGRSSDWLKSKNPSSPAVAQGRGGLGTADEIMGRIAKMPGETIESYRLKAFGCAHALDSSGRGLLFAVIEERSVFVIFTLLNQGSFAFWFDAAVPCRGSSAELIANSCEREREEIVRIAKKRTER